MMMMMRVPLSNCVCFSLYVRTLATTPQEQKEKVTSRRQSVSQSVVVIHFLWNLHGPQRAYAHYSTYARLFLFHFQRAL